MDTNFYGWIDANNRSQRSALEPVRANHPKLRLHIILISSFFASALCRAVGFKFLGYVTNVPLALALLLLVWRPVMRDALKRLPKSD